MSGIAGIIHFDGAPVEPGLIEKMTAAMSHRGPDGTHFWKTNSVAFGHSMLQTTTESLEEVQPWLSEDGRYVLVMDGRLDNWEELRHSLELHGCRLRNRSDAELVIQAFQAWGIDCLKHIEGDFSFVVWDNREKKVHCIRDRMGAKPFHYHWNGKTLSFASELRALFQLPWVAKACNESMLVDYMLVQWCSRTETLWKDILRLPAAHRLEIDSSQFRLVEYWQPELAPLITFSSDDEYIECYRALFLEAVQRCSRSHRRVAFEVSGGLDSSALFAAADHLQKSSRLPAPDIDGYVLSFPDDAAANELFYARAVGQHLDRKIQEVVPNAPSLPWLTEWAQQYGEIPPYPNASMSIGIRELARQSDATALIVGVGGDEWLRAGRNYYAEEIQSRHWQAFGQSWAADKQDYGTLQSLAWALRFGLLPLLPKALKKAIRSPFNAKHPYGKTDKSFLSQHMQKLASERRPDGHTDRPFQTQRQGQQSMLNMLRSPANIEARESEERLAAHYGLELRWPFYNLKLAQFAFSSPDHLRRRGKTDKFIHRRAMAGLLPEAVRNRDTKADFMVTYRRYLSGMERQFCSKIPQRRGAWLKRDELVNLYQITKAGPSCDGMPEWQLWGIFGCDALSV